MQKKSRTCQRYFKTCQDSFATYDSQMEQEILDYSAPRTYASTDIMAELLTRLGNPQAHLPPVLHIAGTNGKGSVVAFLNAILQSAGHKVHATTSPHLVSVCERIQVSNRRISPPELKDLFLHIKPHLEGLDVTYFEIMTAMAFVAFAKHPADYVLLETGMGGLYDATNHVDHPALTLLTSISMDHMDRLGYTLDKIAREKAGIIKYKCPVMSVTQSQQAEDVIRHVSQQKEAPLKFTGALEDTNISLLGAHQKHNAGLACEAARSLQIAEHHISDGLAQAKWPGRMEKILHKGRVCWLDIAHNEAAAQALSRTLTSIDQTPYHLIFSLKRTKEAASFMAPLLNKAQHITYVPLQGCLSADEIINVCPVDITIAPAFSPTLLKHDRTVITGSSQIVGIARALLTQ